MYINREGRFERAEIKLFCATNHGQSVLNRFLKWKLWGDSFCKYVTEECSAYGINEESVLLDMVLHGLCKTVISRLFEAGCGDASIALCSGHFDHRSFTVHGLHCHLGCRQHDGILPKNIQDESRMSVFKGTANDKGSAMNSLFLEIKPK